MIKLNKSKWDKKNSTNFILKKTQKLKFGQNSNYYKTQKLKSWQNSRTQYVLVKTTWHLQNRWDFSGQLFAISRCFKVKQCGKKEEKTHFFAAMCFMVFSGIVFFVVKYTCRSSGITPIVSSFQLDDRALSGQHIIYNISVNTIQTRPRWSGPISWILLLI